MLKKHYNSDKATFFNLSIMILISALTIPNYQADYLTPEDTRAESIMKAHDRYASMPADVLRRKFEGDHETLISIMENSLTSLGRLGEKDSSYLVHKKTIGAGLQSLIASGRIDGIAYLLKIGLSPEDTWPVRTFDKPINLFRMAWEEPLFFRGWIMRQSNPWRCPDNWPLLLQYGMDLPGLVEVMENIGCRPPDEVKQDTHFQSSFVHHLRSSDGLKWFLTQEKFPDWPPFSSPELLLNACGTRAFRDLALFETLANHIIPLMPPKQHRLLFRRLGSEEGQALKKMHILLKHGAKPDYTSVKSLLSSPQSLNSRLGDMLKTLLAALPPLHPNLHHEHHKSADSVFGITLAGVHPLLKTEIFEQLWRYGFRPMEKELIHLEKHPYMARLLEEERLLALSSTLSAAERNHVDQSVRQPPKPSLPSRRT